VGSPGVRERDFVGLGAYLGDMESAIELRHLRYFIAVAEEGSLTLAAETRLHTAQPSLSRQIRDLEYEVGVQLMSRSVHGIELTGWALSRACRPDSAHGWPFQSSLMLGSRYPARANRNRKFPAVALAKMPMTRLGDKTACRWHTSFSRRTSPNAAAPCITYQRPRAD
jgi:hypothetical protein